MQNGCHYCITKTHVDNLSTVQGSINYGSCDVILLQETLAVSCSQWHDLNPWRHPCNPDTIVCNSTCNRSDYRPVTVLIKGITICIQIITDSRKLWCVSKVISYNIIHQTIVVIVDTVCVGRVQHPTQFSIILKWCSVTIIFTRIEPDIFLQIGMRPVNTGVYDSYDNTGTISHTPAISYSYPLKPPLFSD